MSHLGVDEVEIVVPEQLWGFESGNGTTKILKRYQLAIWDYDSIWDDSITKSNGEDIASMRSVPEAQRRLNKLLTSIASNSKTDARTFGSAGVPASQKARFTSSRERKSAAKANRKRGK